MREPELIIVMGVSGCGKTTLGMSLSLALNCRFIEGDDWHSAGNVQKMRQGRALTDEDRAGWLADLSRAIKMALQEGSPVVVSCSALKPAYRNCLRLLSSDIQFLHLDGPKDVIHRRLNQRIAHFMPASLLDSQFEILDILPTETDIISLDSEQSKEALVQQVTEQFRSYG